MKRTWTTFSSKVPSWKLLLFSSDAQIGHMRSNKSGPMRSQMSSAQNPLTFGSTNTANQGLYRPSYNPHEASWKKANEGSFLRCSKMMWNLTKPTPPTLTHSPTQLPNHPITFARPPHPPSSKCLLPWEPVDRPTQIHFAPVGMGGISSHNPSA